MMTLGEQRHAAVVEHELHRIADALEALVKLANNANVESGKEADHGSNP